MTTSEPITEPRFHLAEGPLWDHGRSNLLWVDILEGLVLIGRLGHEALQIETELEFDDYVGSVAVAADGSLLVAERRRLTRVAPDGERTSSPTIEPTGSHDRFNDGVCDAAGRFLVGTLSLAGDHRSQRLLQTTPEHVVVLDEGLGLSNGLGFSPSGDTLYSIDSVPGLVWRRDYDHDTGDAGPRQLLLDLSDATPDGLTVDACGHLWIAIWGGGEVRCYSAAGELLDRIRLPAPHTSSLTFAGDDLDQMVTTTARSELSDAQLHDYPLSGSLFLAVPGCRGLPAHTWSGQLPA